MDVTGAQYGIKESVIPEDDYEKEYSAHRTYFEEGLGRNLRSVNELAAGKEGKGAAAIYKTHTDIASFLMRGLQSLESVSKITAQEMLQMPKEEFQVQRELMLAAVQASIRLGLRQLTQMIEDHKNGS